MKIAKGLVTAVLVASISATAAFAAPSVLAGTEQQSQADTVKMYSLESARKQLDPIKALEAKKEKVQQMLRDGKITQEKADEITARINFKIKKIEEFNKLRPEEKKAKLISEFNARMSKKVKDGKITQDEANEKIEKFTERINQWDGTGYPPIGKKGCVKKQR